MRNTRIKKKARNGTNRSISKHRGTNTRLLKEGSRTLRQRICYVITASACIILIVGTMGISPDRAPRNIPETPPTITNGTVFFAPVAVPKAPFTSLISTEMNLTWDRADVFVVVASEDKKEQCDALSPLERIQSESEICKAGDVGYVAIGLNNSTGLEWTIGEGTYYFGIGTLGDSLENRSGLNIDFAIEIKLSLAGNLFFVSIGALGLLDIYNNLRKYEL